MSLAYGRTDMTKLIVAYGNFANARKKHRFIFSYIKNRNDEERPGTLIRNVREHKPNYKVSRLKIPGSVQIRSFNVAPTC